MNTADFIRNLLERFKIEHTKRDRSGVYSFTQRLLAYNSNKIEGSTLTEEQTASLFVSYLKLTINTEPKMSKKRMDIF